MKTAIIYSSKTGNTKKIAEAILEGIGDKGDLFTVDDNVELANYDLVFMGYWIDKGTADAKALKFIKTITGKKVVIFATLGAYPDSQHGQDSLNNGKTLFADDCEVIDGFICQGAIDPKLTNWMKSLPLDHPHGPDEARLKRWEDASSHPDEKDLAEVKEFAKNVILAL